MADTYNLVDEPWICLLSTGGEVTKEGLKNVFLKAHEYLDLGGELRLQDMAILRLLIAISVTILNRYDENGMKSVLQDKDDALNRFGEVWKAGKFNIKAVEEYFDEWHERFDLFDEEHPFFQLSLKNKRWIKDKECPNGEKPVFENGVFMKWLQIANINGRVQRSDNKPNAPYKDLAGAAVEVVDIDEAARWLLFYNAYADCSVGKRQDFVDQKGNKATANAEMTLPSRGALVTPVGKNLFETIMLNSVLYNMNTKELYDSLCPVWEENVRETEIIKGRLIPNDLARMYTQQARRISLVRKEGKVIGAFASAGESYGSDLLWTEPAFMMHEVKEKGKNTMSKVPMQCKSGVDIWREVDHIAGEKGALVTKWVNVLQDEDIVSEDDVVPFRVTGISYGSMNCGIQSMTEDRIVLSRQFLEDTDLQEAAVKEIARIDEIAKAVYGFGNDSAQCMNFDKKDKRIGKQLSEQYYGEIGQAFRAYLAGELSVQDLRNAEFDCARNVSNQFVEQNVKALLRGKPGENEMYLGKAEKNLGIHLAKIKRKLNG